MPTHKAEPWEADRRERERSATGVAAPYVAEEDGARERAIREGQEVLERALTRGAIDAYWDKLGARSCCA